MSATGSIKIPDSKLAKEAGEILREHSTELLINHSNRVYLYAAEFGRQLKLSFDAELLYVAAAFHDLGLIKEFSSDDQRFEVDGANAARQFLETHNVPEDKIQNIWEAIALHTTPGITPYMAPEVNLLCRGVELDVLGVGYHDFPVDLRQEIVAAHPRIDFKAGIVKAFFGGFEHKPHTTWGNCKADICERFIPGFHSPSFVDMIANSPFPNSH